MDQNQAKVKNKIFAAVKFGILILIVAGIPAYIYFFHRDFITQFSSMEEAADFLRQYKSLSVLVYLCAEVLQILISVLPGQVFQFAAGYLFGFLPGLLYTFVGAILGTTITFFIARFLGSDAIHLMLGEERTEKYTRMLESRRAYLITFLIYLIPGIPKDTVCYIAGVSGIKFLPFLVISVTGRMPAMAGSIIFGSMYMKGNYKGMAVVAVIVAIFFVISFIKRKEVMGFLDSLYSKYQ